MCMSRTKSSMAASCSAEARTTRSGPSATMVRSSSVTRVAISTMTWRRRVEPGHLEVHPDQHAPHATGRSAPGGRRSRVARAPCKVRRCCVSRCTSSTPSSPCPSTRGRVTPAPTCVPGPTPSLARGGGRALVPTGVAVAIPAGYAGFVLPRSGLAARHGVTCLNAPGLIDSGYRGEMHVVLVNPDPDRDYVVRPG